MLEISATNLSVLSPRQTCLFSEALVRTCPALANEPDLMGLAHACFLKESDYCDYKALRVSYLRMSPDCSAVTEGVTLNKSSVPSLNWGIAFRGNFGMEPNGFPKTENESSLLVLSGNVRNLKVSPTRPTLQQCLETPGVILDRHPAGDRIYDKIAPTLRSLASTNGHQGGSGAFKVLMPDGTTRPLRPTECERLMGWEVGSTEFGITADGQEIKISNTQRIKMLGNGIIPQEIEDLCNSLRPILERLKESDYGILGELDPARCLATEGGSESNTHEDSATTAASKTIEVSASIATEDSMVHAITSSVFDAAKNFSVGDRVTHRTNGVVGSVTYVDFRLATPQIWVQPDNLEGLECKAQHPYNPLDLVQVERLQELEASSLGKLDARDSSKMRSHDGAKDLQVTQADVEILADTLSPLEEKERHRLELRVERAFYEAGKALAEIRDRRLYRSTHPNDFIGYCRDRFGKTKQAANYLIAAAGVYENLTTTNGCRHDNETQTTTIGCRENNQAQTTTSLLPQTLPTSERQVRPLVSLDPEEQRQVWQEAVDLADGKVPTGKLVKGVVERLKEKPLNFAHMYCAEGEIFRLQRLDGADGKYNGWWGIALEVENRLTVSCQVYDKTIEIRQHNIKRIDMTEEQLIQQREIIERVSRLARCNLDPAAWALLETLNRQNHYTDYQLQMLYLTEKYYGIQVTEN